RRRTHVEHNESGLPPKADSDASITDVAEGPIPEVADSFSLDVRRLDNRPPLLDLGLVESAQCLWRLLLTRWNLHAEIGDPLAHRHVCHCSNCGTIELHHDFSRRVLGCPKAVPSRDVDSRQAKFVRGWNVGRSEPARLGHDR